MSEFEYIEAAQLAMNWLIDGSINTVGVTFAYIVAAHLAGVGLSKLAAVGLSVLYSLFIIGPVSGMLGGARNHVFTVMHYHEAFPDGWAFGDTPDFLYLIAITIGPLFLAWLGSLSYLHLYVRKGI